MYYAPSHGISTDYPLGALGSGCLWVRQSGCNAVGQWLQCCSVAGGCETGHTQLRTCCISAEREKESSKWLWTTLLVFATAFPKLLRWYFITSCITPSLPVLRAKIISRGKCFWIFRIKLSGRLDFLITLSWFCFPSSPTVSHLSFGSYYCTQLTLFNLGCLLIFNFKIRSPWTSDFSFCMLRFLNPWESLKKWLECSVCLFHFCVECSSLEHVVWAVRRGLLAIL